GAARVCGLCFACSLSARNLWLMPLFFRNHHLKTWNFSNSTSAGAAAAGTAAAGTAAAGTTRRSRLFRRGRGAPAEMAQAAVDPCLCQLLLGAVLRQPPPQCAEIDAVEILVLVEAGEHHRLRAGRRVVMALQALGADLLHHALHRRVDRRDGAVPRAEIALQRGAPGLADGVHHAVGADRDDAVDLGERDLDRPERA